MIDDALRFLSLCIMLASVETLHGIIRAAILVPKTGKKKALKISIVSGSMLAFAVCYYMVPPMQLSGAVPLFILGLSLSLFMAGFDVLLGKCLLRRSWQKILQDFNPGTGNYLLVGLLLLATFPYIVMQL